MKIRYIGMFPPPYGGVTIKNKLIFDSLSEKKEIEIFKKPSWLPGPVFRVLNLLTGILPKQTLIIGVSAAGGKSKLVTGMLYFFAKQNMRRSLYFMMGGQECYRIAGCKKEIKWYSEYKRIYVETETMKSVMVDAGLDNVEVFPNCRKKPSAQVVPSNNHKQLQCVFFSYIQPEKGADIILETAKKLADVEFVFYGPIDEKFKEAFERSEAELENVHYKGVFIGLDTDKYQELNKYDILLLPTRWKTEGVPGILVEGKISGLAEIVSDVSYNAELVKNNLEGIVLKENTAECLSKSILYLEENRDILKKLKYNSFKSAEKFYIETYLPRILCLLE